MRRKAYVSGVKQYTFQQEGLNYVAFVNKEGVTLSLKGYRYIQ